MASEYTYDEEGETWPFFVLALLSFVLIPLTVQWGYRIFSQDDPISVNATIKGSIVKGEGNMELENSKQVVAHGKKQKSSKVLNKTLVFLLIGWCSLMYVAMFLTPQLGEAQIGAFDPYAILDIAHSASEKEVKSKFKKMSLKYHPDKLPRGLTDEEKLEMEAQYIQLSLAHKSLTDEVTRNNFLKFGHPDGPQETKHGIALPKFLVEGRYSLLMVLVYFLLIGGVLPLIVGSWWNNVKTHTKRGIHVDTAAVFAKKLADRNPAKIITQYDILDWLCMSQEVKSEFGHLLPNGPSAAVGGPNTFTLIVRDLISRHLFRNFELSAKEPKYEDEKLKILATLPKLLSGLIEIATVFRQTDVVLAAMDVSKSLTQAVTPLGKYQELLQLPFVDSKVIQSQPVKKLGKLFTLNKEEQKKVLGIKDDDKLAVALEVAEHIPQIRILDASFIVPGENNVEEDGLPYGSVPPNANAHLSIKFLIKSPKQKSCPDIDDSRIRDEETIEYMRNPISTNDLQPQLPYTYSPYSPNNSRNFWQGILINQRDNKIAEGSNVFYLENASLSNLEISQDQYIKGQDVVISSFKVAMTTPTPGAPADYPFRLILKNSGYFGCDVDVPVIMTVATPTAPSKKLLTKKVRKIIEIQGSDDEGEQSDSESDISDPEEDSIAGALAALRGASVKKSEGGEDEVEEEDDEDDDVSIFTDINTDTEDEGEN